MEEFFSGKISHGRDPKGRIFVDVDPQAFRHILNFLSYDRNWLPPHSDASMRKLVENEICRWGLDKDLEKPLSSIDDVIDKPATIRKRDRAKKVKK